MRHLSSKRPEILSELKSITLFSELDDKQLDVIIEQSRIIDLKAGENLFYAGEPAPYFYYLKQGQIRVFLESSEGNEKVIDVIHSEQMFAEAMAFLDRETYPVSTQALKKSTLYAIDIAAFKGVLSESIESCFRVMAALTKRLHFQLMEINNLSLHNATYRLISHLIQQIPKNTDAGVQVILDYPKNVLASRLSIKPETLSRILLRMKNKEFIDVNGNQIILKNPEELKQYLHNI